MTSTVISPFSLLKSSPATESESVLKSTAVALPLSSLASANFRSSEFVTSSGIMRPLVNMKSTTILPTRNKDWMDEIFDKYDRDLMIMGAIGLLVVFIFIVTIISLLVYWCKRNRIEFKRFKNESAPSTSTNSLKRTKEADLWINTENNMARYDKLFQTVTLDLPQPNRSVPGPSVPAKPTNRLSATPAEANPDTDDVYVNIDIIPDEDPVFQPLGVNDFKGNVDLEEGDLSSGLRNDHENSSYPYGRSLSSNSRHSFTPLNTRKVDGEYADIIGEDIVDDTSEGAYNYDNEMAFSLKDIDDAIYDEPRDLRNHTD